MDKKLIESADAVGMFCRFQMNTKKNIPVRSSEMGVLIFIKRSSLSVTPLMISEFFNISKPSVTTIIKALVKEKYIVRIPSPIDKRSYIVEITNRGNVLFTKTFDEYFKLIGLLKKEMNGDDFIQMIELIKKANKILKGDH